MSSNVILRIAVLAVIGVGLVIVLGGRDDEPTGQLQPVAGGPSEQDNGLAFDPLTDDVLESEFGVDVDTPEETMRTLTLETQAVREQSAQLQEENEELRTEIDRLLGMEASIADRVDSRVQNAETFVDQQSRSLAEQRDRLNALASRLERRLDEVDGPNKKKRKRSAGQGAYAIGSGDIPAGLGYDGLDMDPEERRYANEVVWVNPLDVSVDKKGGIQLPDFDVGNPIVDLPLPRGSTDNGKKRKREERLIPAYTIPENATLMGSTALTAMLGRIPIGGSVIDPYEAKFIVGPENLATNGIVIPGLEGIVASATVVGDWNLSCNRATIRSLTFTFQDGTVTTVPQPRTVETEQREVDLGYISSAQGIPCITGQRISNAPQYLGTRAGIAALEGFAEAAARSEVEVNQGIGNSGFSSAVTGDATRYAAAKGISDGLSTTGEWIDQRMADSFDAIYAPPETQVVLNFSKEIAIDYDPEGRKVNYDFIATTAARDLP